MQGKMDKQHGCAEPSLRIRVRGEFYDLNPRTCAYCSSSTSTALKQFAHHAQQ